VIKKFKTSTNHELLPGFLGESNFLEGWFHGCLWAMECRPEILCAGFFSLCFLGLAVTII
jgi:hypothetical protein